MICQGIYDLTGNKSQKIMELINRKLKEDKRKMLSKHIKDKKLLTLIANFKAKKNMYDKAKNMLKKREEQLGIEWSTYIKKYEVSDICRISKQDYQDLDKANSLYGIGKRKEAQTIWERLIKKHNLF